MKRGWDHTSRTNMDTPEESNKDTNAFSEQEWFEMAHEMYKDYPTVNLVPEAQLSGEITDQNEVSSENLFTQSQLESVIYESDIDSDDKTWNTEMERNAPDFPECVLIRNNSSAMNPDDGYYAGLSQCNAESTVVPMSQDVYINQELQTQSMLETLSDE